MLKLCKDCTHYRPPMTAWGMWAPGACLHACNMSEPELVRGTSAPLLTPEELRAGGAPCGPEGEWWWLSTPEPTQPAVMEAAPTGLWARLTKFARITPL